MTLAERRLLTVQLTNHRGQSSQQKEGRIFCSYSAGWSAAAFLALPRGADSRASSYGLASLFNVSNGDIVRSDIISIMRIAANNTAKRRLRGSVRLVHMPTATPARCIPSINRFNLDAALAGHVPDLGEQRCERPSVHDQSLLFGAFDPCADASEVFNRNCPGGHFQGFTNNPVGHIPEQPINRSLLFARQPFQEPSLVAALVLCGLKIAALFESALSNMFDRPAVESFAGVDSSNADDTRIDADHAITLRVRNAPGDDQVQIPDSTFAGNRSRWFNFPFPVEVLPMVVGENQVNPGSAVKRGQRGVLLVEFDCQRSGVISHRRCFLPSVTLFFVSFVRLRDHIASGANEICWKLSDVSHVPIGNVMKRD